MSQEDETCSVTARWVVDASGRVNILRRNPSRSRRPDAVQATSGRVSAFTNSSSWSVRQHSNAVQCFS